MATVTIDAFYPFDSVSNDRPTTADTERQFLGTMYQDGVVGSGLLVTASNQSGGVSVAPGVAVIGGAVGIIKSAKSVNAATASGSSIYVVMRVDTRQSARMITLETASSPLTATTAQLSAGAQRDIALARVTNQAGVYTIEDVRPYCTSFDATHFDQEVQRAIAEMQDGASAAIAEVQAAAEAAFERATDGVYANAIINGGMQVDQRKSGGTYSISSGQSYTLDRWLARLDGTASEAFTVSQRVARGYGSAAPTYAMRIQTRPISSSGMFGIGQFIELGAERLKGETVTVSFSAAASTAQPVAVNLQVRYSDTDYATLTSAPVNVGTAYARYSSTFSIPGRLQADANNIKVTIFTTWSGAEARSRFGTATDNNLQNIVYLGDIVLSVGDSPRPYVPPHMTDELERCRRYYRRYGLTTLGASPMKSNSAVKTQMVDFAGMMRPPALMTTDQAGTQGRASWELTTSGIEHGHMATPTSNSDGYGIVWSVTGSGTSQVAAASIIFGSIEADAEIYY